VLGILEHVGIYSECWNSGFAEGALAEIDCAM